MDPHGSKQEPVDPKAAERILELELMKARAARQQAQARYRGLRTASFAFIFLIVLGILLALYCFFYLGGFERIRTLKSLQSSPAPMATPLTH